MNRKIVHWSKQHIWRTYKLLDKKKLKYSEHNEATSTYSFMRTQNK